MTEKVPFERISSRRYTAQVNGRTVYIDKFSSLPFGNWGVTVGGKVEWFYTLKEAKDYVRGLAK